MATAPVKSRTLHNFSLPHWRWAFKNHHSPHSSHHRFRRRDSPDIHQTASLPSSSPSYAAESDRDHDDTNAHTTKHPSSRTLRKPFSFSPCSSQPQQYHKDATVWEKEKKKEKDDGLEEGESDAKPWKLRPRKVVTVPTASFRKGGKMSDTVAHQKHESCDGGYGLPKSARLREAVVESGGVGLIHGSGYGSERQRKVVEEKRKLWISLSREEIEEDIYSLTQSKPPRRPKKRPKNIQKQLDNVFPGLYLVGMSADSYRIHDSQK